MRIGTAVVGIAIACSVAVAGCGSSSDSGTTGSTSAGAAATGASTTSGASGDVKIDVGSKTLTFPAGTKPKIAMFAGSGIAYQTAYQKEVPKLEKKYGIDITYFDSKFDPTAQLNQMRSAVQNKKFNAWIVENYAGASACTIETKQAPAANIVVSPVTNPTCDQATKPWGDAYWSPGTLNSVGAVSSSTYYTGWVKAAKALMGTEEPKVAVISGPPLVPATNNMKQAFTNNDIKPVAFFTSDYTTPTALKTASDLLQAHSDVNAIFSVGPDVTVGIVSALKAAGKKPGEVKVFEVGGAEQNFDLIRQGWLTMASPYAPVTTIDAAVGGIVDAFAGKQGPRAVPALSQGTPQEPYQITKENVDQYPAQY
jgi:ABC-type sugar transport system substrate-binding protein